MRYPLLEMCTVKACYFLLEMCTVKASPTLLEMCTVVVVVFCLAVTF